MLRIISILIFVPFVVLSQQINTTDSIIENNIKSELKKNSEDLNKNCPQILDQYIYLKKVFYTTTTVTF